MNYNHKKMKKNGYIDVSVEIPVKGVKKDETVYVNAIDFGKLTDDSMVTCIKNDNSEVIIPKRNLIIK